jgi:cbb3-type cytochrome oxidase subunit 3
MFRELLTDNNVNLLVRAALVIFFLVFCAVVAWVLTRSRKQVSEWASLPLDDSMTPKTPREERK